MHLKMSSAKWRPFCLGPNVLRTGKNREYFTEHKYCSKGKKSAFYLKEMGFIICFVYIVQNCSAWINVYIHYKMWGEIIF